MQTQAATAATTPDTPREPRRPSVYAPYNPHSNTVAAKHLHLVVGLSYVTCWRKRRAGNFPAPIRLSIGRRAWLRSDLEAWLAAQVGR